jgi:hypothetical protein
MSNQVPQNFTGRVSVNPIFTVSDGGDITPTATQTVSRNGTVVIAAALAPNGSPSSNPYTGYICAWGNGACRCSTLVSSTGSEPHMVNQQSYAINANAPIGSNYTLYTTMSENDTTGPTGNATQGDIHIGG